MNVMVYEYIVQLKWLSTFLEYSFSDGGTMVEKENVCVNKEQSHNHFLSSSPVSVLESSNSSSSCSGGKTIRLSPNHRGTQPAKSKRPRPTTFNPRAAIQLISPSSSFIETPKPFVAPGFSSEAEKFAESPPAKKITTKQKKKKKIKFTFPASLAEMQLNPPPQSVRKCVHCEITKTPQWRGGPMGPKTLWNACGVRHKSGRLFPEYHPAAGPTFVPSLYSKSHKKVIEMRNRDELKIRTTTTPVAAKPEFLQTTLP